MNVETGFKVNIGRLLIREFRLDCPSLPKVASHFRGRCLKLNIRSGLSAEPTFNVYPPQKKTYPRPLGLPYTPRRPFHFGGVLEASLAWGGSVPGGGGGCWQQCQQ